MTETLSLFFAMVAVAGGLFAAAMAVLAVVRLATGKPLGEGFLAQLRPIAPFLAFGVATASMLGSLYYSEIANYTPCRMCWIQRFFMYPSAILLGAAVFGRVRRLLWVSLGLSVIGIGVSAYHRMEQAFPDSVGGACSLEVPCSARWVNEFGFVTIPTMAGAGFALVITFLLVALRSQGELADA